MGFSGQERRKERPPDGGGMSNGSESQKTGTRALTAYEKWQKKRFGKVEVSDDGIAKRRPRVVPAESTNWMQRNSKLPAVIFPQQPAEAPPEYATEPIPVTKSPKEKRPQDDRPPWE